ncbi:MAG: hypothetical protein ABSA30_14625, partial [Candidatus Aminicenantales bacterium]
YNDPSLQETLPPGAKPKIVFSWNTDKKGTFSLPDVNYSCPQCGKMTLRFTQNGFWDLVLRKAAEMDAAGRKVRN